MRSALSRSRAFGVRSRVGELQGRASLNLTPMVDMLTVLIIFLIKSYSASPAYLNSSQKVELAITASDMAAPDKAVILIGKDGIFVEGKVIVPFKEGVPMNGAMGNDEIMPALEKHLLLLAEKTKAIAAKNPKVEFTGTLILQADKGIPFTSLRPILKTAGIAGYHDFKFAGLYPN